MTSLMMLNCSTFRESAAFKARALSSGLVGEDLMDTHPPRAGLVGAHPRVATVSDADNSLLSFYYLTPGIWRSRIGTGRAAKTFSTVFGEWLSDIARSSPEVVYLAGHHGSHMLWGKDDGWRVDFNDKNHLGFQTYDNKAPVGRVSVPTDPFLRNCKLLLGFGCNIAATTVAAYYRQYFHSGARFPVVLGWAGTVSLPTRKEPSIVDAFFDTLDAFAADPRRTIPATDRIDWFYRQLGQPELVAAWGEAVKAYGNREPRRLLTDARAIVNNGTVYRFGVDKSGQVTTDPPLKLPVPYRPSPFDDSLRGYRREGLEPR